MFGLARLIGCRGWVAVLALGQFALEVFLSVRCVCELCDFAFASLCICCSRDLGFEEVDVVVQIWICYAYKLALGMTGIIDL